MAPNGPSVDLISRDLLQSLHALRVKELQDILVTLHMPKTGSKPELVRRLMEMGSSVILIRHAGGKHTAEAAIKRAHMRLAAERGQFWDESRPGTYTTIIQGRGEKRRHPSHASHDPWRDPRSVTAQAHAQAPPDPGAWARVLACDPFWAAADAPRLASTPGVVMAPRGWCALGAGTSRRCSARSRSPRSSTSCSEKTPPRPKARASTSYISRA